MPWDTQDPGPALAELFQRHGEGLAGAVRGVLGRRADVAEVLQEAFVKALAAMRRGTRPADAVAWVFVVTLNAAKDQRRRWRRPRGQTLDEVSAMELQARQTPVATELSRREAVHAAQAAIERLQDHEKEVFLLRVSGGLTFEDTAQALGIPVGTAKSRMRAALGRLRRQLATLAPNLDERR